MTRRLLPLIMSIVVIATLALVAVRPYLPAHADPGIITMPWPGIPFAATVYAHGDGSFTAATATGTSCSTNYSATTPVAVTYDSNQSNPDTVYGTSADGVWSQKTCTNQQVAGSDGTTYFIQQQIAKPNKQRVLAVRHGVMLWAQEFGSNSGTCNGFNQDQLFDLALGYDGNLYMNWLSFTSCTSSTLKLLSLNTATGDIRFANQLPSNVAASGTMTSGSDILPYENGIAVVNNHANIYFYSYAGVLDSSKTFTPDVLGSNPTPQSAVITVDGRVYLNAYSSTVPSKLLYRDIGEIPSHEIVPPSGKSFLTMYATPSDGLAVRLNDASSQRYLGYYNSQGTEVYEVGLESETGANTLSSLYFSVDNLGNVITVRTMVRTASPNDKVVYVDSFSPTGAKTRLLDSEAQFGSAGIRDQFVSTGLSPQSIGSGKIYIGLCHVTSGTLTTCNSLGNPQIVIIPTASQFDYPRSKVFAIAAVKQNYVAMGDSYSSGESNSPYIAPSDTDNCHRSYQAYPMILGANSPDLKFVACSGAATGDLYENYNSEPPQLDSLDSSTTLVTISIGGNDIGFAQYAFDCINPTSNCDESSEAYLNIMGNANFSLPSLLSTLFQQIHTLAPNAQVYVLGYPYVAAQGGSYCPYLTSGEIDAITNVADALDNTVSSAVTTMQNSGASFHFVDPRAVGNPFLYHDVCSSNGYFVNIINGDPSTYSFHPNQQGQLAYESMLLEALTDNSN